MRADASAAPDPSRQERAAAVATVRAAQARRWREARAASARAWATAWRRRVGDAAAPARCCSPAWSGADGAPAAGPESAASVRADRSRGVRVVRMQVRASTVPCPASPVGGGGGGTASAVHFAREGGAPLPLRLRRRIPPLKGSGAAPLPADGEAAPAPTRRAAKASSWPARASATADDSHARRITRARAEPRRRSSAGGGQLSDAMAAWSAAATAGAEAPAAPAAARMWSVRGGAAGADAGEATMSGGAG
mmetsp:Transcript_3047/g.12578  ORF Transcript_3047/g.12578 Transcript_3047/m.12578 type:complete len:251 (-) Transcript_3047:280-1032(-)